MGCCLTFPTDSNSVESNINLSHVNKSIKVLVLGTSGCGKTTIIKQLEKIHNVYQQNWYSTNNVSCSIRDTVVADMKTLCRSCQQPLNDNTNKHHRDTILTLHPPYTLNTDIATKIKQLYVDDGIQATLKKRDKLHLTLCDNIEHFFDKIDEIALEDYTPTFEDYIKINRQTNGCPITKFRKSVDNFGEYIFEIPDIGGARSERRKWWHPKLLLDPDLNTIIYVLAISEYNLFLCDDEENAEIAEHAFTANRLTESIDLFEQMIELMIGKYGEREFFENKSIILLFNKYDLFCEKIKSIPITVAFDNFPANMRPTEADDVIRFIAGQFMNVFSKCGLNLQKPLRIIRTVAVDTANIAQMFEKIAPEIVINYTNFKNANKRKSGLVKIGLTDGFDAPLIVPQLQTQYSTPTHHDHLPPLILKSRTHSLPVTVNSKTKIPKKSIVFTDI